MINNTARDEINFEWTVKYTDGTTLEQFDDIAQETYHFGHIDLDRLDTFFLTNKATNSVYSLDINTGEFFHNGTQLLVPGLSVAENDRVAEKKLIYFRRYKRSFTPGSPHAEVEVSYFLGWEYGQGKDKVKRVIEIDGDTGAYKLENQ